MYNQKQKLEDDIIRFSRELKELKKEMNKLSVEINPLNQQVIIFYSTSILLPLSINQSTNLYARTQTVCAMSSRGLILIHRSKLPDHDDSLPNSLLSDASPKTLHYSNRIQDDSIKTRLYKVLY